MRTVFEPRSRSAIIIIIQDYANYQDLLIHGNGLHSRYCEDITISAVEIYHYNIDINIIREGSFTIHCLISLNGCAGRSNLDLDKVRNGLVRQWTVSPLFPEEKFLEF